MSRISYDLTKIRGVVFDVDGVLSPSTIPTSESGEPLRMVNIKDGYALQLAVKMGLKLAIITGGRSRGVEVRYHGLGIKDVFSGVAEKTAVLSEWLAVNSLAPEEVAYVGDDIPDYRCMQMVGLSVAPADACSDIKAIAGYISPVEGCHGVARDLIEQILRAQGLWMAHAKAFGW